MVDLSIVIMLVYQRVTWLSENLGETSLNPMVSKFAPIGTSRAALRDPVQAALHAKPTTAAVRAPGEAWNPEKSGIEPTDTLW